MKKSCENRGAGDWIKKMDAWVTGDPVRNKRRRKRHDKRACQERA